MKKQSILFGIVGIITLIFIIAGCGEQQKFPLNDKELNVRSELTPPPTQCEPVTWDLIAGQTIDVGSVTVTNDADYIYITYTIDHPDACFGTLQVWVGDDLADMPQNKKGTPIPGQFCQVNSDWCFDATGQTSYTFTIPFSDLDNMGVNTACEQTLFVVTHAEVDMDCDPETDEHETAFSGDESGSGPRWWFYGEYSICCYEPPSGCQTETGWGGNTGVNVGEPGAWWYYFKVANGSPQTIYAGQTIDVGIVTYNSTQLTITLTGGWELQDVAQPVKIQGYNEIPDKRPASGQFDTYKGTDLIITVPLFDYYAIHLDVQICTP
ncbi:hypothetical protein JXQ31_13505 [candidate division KSB1 bacterium]|nr:hypothetical protein [candidate division KSB1 bacterium]